MLLWAPKLQTHLFRGRSCCSLLTIRQAKHRTRTTGKTKQERETIGQINALLDSFCITPADASYNTWCSVRIDPARDMRSAEEAFLEVRASPSAPPMFIAFGVRTRRLEGKSNLSMRGQRFSDRKGWAGDGGRRT